MLLIYLEISLLDMVCKMYTKRDSQGRLEALFNFQTLVTELTGLPAAVPSSNSDAFATGNFLGFIYSFFELN